MNSKHCITTLVLFFLLGGSAIGQQDRKPETGSSAYRNAIGIRAGTTSGPAFKHFMNSGNAFEVILGLWPNAFGITGLYEVHTGTGISGLNFYYGAGAHLTLETGEYYYRRHGKEEEYRHRYGHDGFAVGVDGLAGIEYKIRPIPLALSLDLKPFVEVSNYGKIYTALDAGLGIKLAF